MRRFALLLSPFIVAVAALVIVDSLARGSSGMSLAPAYLAERYLFYAETLFVGPRAVVLIPAFYYALLTVLRRAPQSAADVKGLSLASLGLAIAGAIVVAVLPPLGPVALLAAGVAVARRERTLWVGIAWFAVGFAVYLVPRFYHQAYILEAFLGVALMVACCTPRLARDVLAATRALRSASRLARGAAVGAVALVVVAIVAGGLMIAPDTLSSGRAAVLGLVDTNRTFRQTVDHLSTLQPGNVTVLAFSNEQRGLSKEDWRNRGLGYRATVVPVMDLPELQNMLTALRGPGMTLVPFAAPGQVTVPDGTPLYAVAFGAAESRDIAEAWAATPVARFANGDATSTVFRLQTPES